MKHSSSSLAVPPNQTDHFPTTHKMKTDIETIFEGAWATPIAEIESKNKKRRIGKTKERSNETMHSPMFTKSSHMLLWQKPLYSTVFRCLAISETSSDSWSQASHEQLKPLAAWDRPPWCHRSKPLQHSTNPDELKCKRSYTGLEFIISLAQEPSSAWRPSISCLIQNGELSRSSEESRWPSRTRCESQRDWSKILSLLPHELQQRDVIWHWNDSNTCFRFMTFFAGKICFGTQHWWLPSSSIHFNSSKN